jgi:hypothetical protein
MRITKLGMLIAFIIGPLKTKDINVCRMLIHSAMYLRRVEEDIQFNFSNPTYSFMGSSAYYILTSALMGISNTSIAEEIRLL